MSAKASDTPTDSEPDDESQSLVSAGDAVGYDPITDTFHARFDDSTDDVVLSVVEAVAVATNRSLTEVPPLYGSINPEALSMLVTSGRGRTIATTFTYAECRVTVSTRGEVVVEPAVDVVD